ncbi:SGNH/GDSL hydrolase family protein [Arthrobacter crystallopoietes]|uniref:SGNH/GDSL hydrolase family protein n=1 Tax=Crystallibacter crystallopoietes TaxID=37928 RepID=UPI00111131FD|nr:SGNH/GDSL hydrolase family protein [Arthrobacter crystallopoietes]
MVHNSGIGGNTTQQLLDRLGADVLTRAGEIVALNIGVNDLYNGQGITVTTIKANLAEIVKRIVAAGKYVAWSTTTPAGGATTTIKANGLEVNQWIRDHAKLYRGAVTLVDMNPATVDAHGAGRP